MLPPVRKRNDTIHGASRSTQASSIRQVGRGYLSSITGHACNAVSLVWQGAFMFEIHLAVYMMEDLHDTVLG